MAKKPDIGSKDFSKLLEGLKYKPNNEIIRRIDSKMFAFDNNKVLNYKPHELAFEEFSRCLSLFESRSVGLNPNQAMNRLAGVYKLINRFEEPVKDKLEALAIKTIKDIYQVPDYVNLKAIINPNLSLNTTQDKSPQPFLNLTLEQKNSMRDEINKRIVLNSLVHGSSMQVWKGVYHLVSAELKELNPELVELYDYYTALIGITIWQISPDISSKLVENNIQMTQGFNKLTFNKEQGFGGDIEAQALNFPVLLHELNKGVIDWLVSAGIPSQYNEEELRYYYSKSDAYELEHFMYLLGPSLWNILLDSVQISNENIPLVISKISTLNYIELTNLFRSLIDDDLTVLKKYDLT